MPDLIAPDNIRLPIRGPDFPRPDPQLIKDLWNVSSATTSAMLHSMGIRQTFIQGPGAMQRGKKVVGPVVTLQFMPQREDVASGVGQEHSERASALWSVLDAVEKGDVLAIQANGDPYTGCLGEMLVTYFKGRGGAGILVDGYIRDWPKVRELDVPLWTRGATPNYASQSGQFPWAYNVPVALSRVLVIPGDILIADDDGAVIIPAKMAPAIVTHTLEHEEWETFSREQPGRGRFDLEILPAERRRPAGIRAVAERSERKTGMKITEVRTILLSRLHEPERQWFSSTFRSIKADGVVVEIETDEGLKGIGEACAYGGPVQIESWVRLVSSRTWWGTIPASPTLPPHPNGRSHSHDAAVGGIDCALWDLRGQIAGKPTAQLLNPGALSKVRLYASAGCQYDWRNRPEQVIDEALGFVEQGFTAYKFRIGTHWAWDGVTVDRFLGLVRELAQAVDGRMELMAEGNQRLTEDQALQIGKEIDRLGFIWFEEPIPMADIDGYARLNAALDLPISGGEQLDHAGTVPPLPGETRLRHRPARRGLVRDQRSLPHRRNGPPLRHRPVPAQLAQRPDGDGKRASGGRAAQPARSGSVHAPGAAAVGHDRPAAGDEGRLDDAARAARLGGGTGAGCGAALPLYRRAITPSAWNGR